MSKITFVDYGKGPKFEASRVSLINGVIIEDKKMNLKVHKTNTGQYMAILGGNYTARYISSEHSEPIEARMECMAAAEKLGWEVREGRVN